AQMIHMRQQALKDRITHQSRNTADFYGEDFNLGRELTNPYFRDLLATGMVDVQTAYEIVHKQDLMEAALHQAVTDTKKRMAASQYNQRGRPVENGRFTAKGGAAPFDPEKLSFAAQKEIEKRVLRGERITPSILKAYTS
ncbi:MAG: hypothetical protein GX786_07515, partial [Clostridiales bacterium]|nr:hypothetical protein [Clostridiales bacterium]